MTTMIAHKTLALDLATESTIHRLAKLWKTSESEVVRRSVANAEKASANGDKASPLAALDWLQSHGSLTEVEVAKWAQESKRGWRESWSRKALTSRVSEKNKHSRVKA